MKEHITPERNTRGYTELADIVTKDMMVHQGIYFEPSVPGKTAIAWVHGLTGKFYSEPAFIRAVTEQCEARGYGFASFNTRGHDYVTSVHKLDKSKPEGYVYETIGASVETFTDCVFDLDAVVSFLVGKGYENVILVGHSTGANKVCYYAAAGERPNLGGIVLAGPMSDRYSAGFDEVQHGKHRAFMEKKIREGNGDEILTGFDFFPLTPKRWMSLLAEGSAEDVFNYRDETDPLSTFSRIRIPVLTVFGEKDEHADRPIEEIRESFGRHTRSDNYGSLVIPDADHGFSGKEHEFIKSVLDWVGTLVSEG